MQSSMAGMARELSDLLRLSAPPIGIHFDRGDGSEFAPRYRSAAPPPTDDGRTGPVPAGCIFWFKATEEVFSTVAEDHANCSVGSYTHGFKSLDEAAGKADVGALFASGWITDEDVPGIEHVRERPGSVIYGPLERMTVEPDVVFLRINGKQAMFLDDALGGVRFEGKPQCHIIAIAKESGEPAISVGCMLSRVRTGMSNNEMTCAIPFRKMTDVVEKLRTNAAIERSVAEYAAQDAMRFAVPSPIIR